jgi:flagellar basal-body rod protein FlgC
MNLLSALSVSASGMSAQRQRTELLVENLANAETTRTPEGGPYRRKDVVFAADPDGSSFSSLFENQTSPSINSSGVGVRVAQVVTDTREPEKRYMPGHPDADPDGYVAFPRMNPSEDMVDLLNASRTYQANVSAISAVKDMLQKSMELFK